jgi:hypothetical protein
MEVGLGEAGASGSGSNKRPLNTSNSSDRTPLSKRPNVEQRDVEVVPETDIIKIEVSKVNTY